MLKVDKGKEEPVDSEIESEGEPDFSPTVSVGNQIGIPECDFGLAQHELLVNTDEQVDVESDPLASVTKPGPTSEWEKEMQSISPREIEVPLADQQIERIQSLLRRIESEKEEPDESAIADLIREIQGIGHNIPDHETFVAGSFQKFYPAWNELLGRSGRKSSKSILSWLRNGYRPRFEGSQNAKPEKLKVVRAMLEKVVGQERVDAYLTGVRPKRIEFPNHRSFYDRWEFAEGEIRKNLKSGAVAIWPQGKELPEVISPMGVVESAGKERLICNDRYLNAFLKQIPFEYEKLRDVLSFTERNSFMATADLKSGYFHVPIHPAYWKYFAFRVGSTVFFYKVLCFGFAQACFVFTKIMREPILEIRSKGIPMSGYIDDSFTAARTFGRSLRQILYSSCS